MSAQNLKDEIVTDVRAKFPGGATVGDLALWLGEPEDRIRECVRELLQACRLWPVNGRYVANRPDLEKARRALAVGFPLTVAGVLVGQEARELDVSLWRDLARRAHLQQRRQLGAA